MLSGLEQELLINSPTFRTQVANAFTAVAVRRWKLAKFTAMSVDGLIQAGTATISDLVARSYAQTEMAFLEQSLAKQKIYLGQHNQQPYDGPGAINIAEESTTRLINQLFSCGAWTWSVAEWLGNQSAAIAAATTALDTMLADMVAVPSQQASEIQQAAATLQSTINNK